MSRVMVSRFGTSASAAAIPIPGANTGTLRHQARGNDVLRLPLQLDYGTRLFVVRRLLG